MQTFRAKTMREALAKVRTAYGPRAAVLHTREVDRGLLASWLYGSAVEVVARGVEPAGAVATLSSTPQDGPRDGATGRPIAEIALAATPSTTSELGESGPECKLPRTPPRGNETEPARPSCHKTTN